MPTYEVVTQRVYLVRTREETTFLLEGPSASAVREQAGRCAQLDRSDTGRAWDVLKERHLIHAVHVCHVKRLVDQPPRPFSPFERLRLALGWL